MKKLLIFALCIFMLVFFVSCTFEENPTDTNPTDTNPTDTAQTEEVKKDVDLTIKSHSLSKDYADKDVLVIEYTFVNNTDKANSFTLLCNDKVFQNGIECSNLVIGCDEIDSQKSLTDVKPGIEFTLTVGYLLNDLESPVEIEVTDLFGDVNYLQETIALK